MTKIYDCVIIGAGPSGLTAGNILSKNKLDFLIIDKGDYLYNRDSTIPKDVVTGIGGGGLFSDGKLSFYPSGSSLYKLSPPLLEESYRLLTESLQKLRIAIPQFDYNWIKSNSEEQPNVSKIKQKNYDSIVLSQDQLYRFGFSLYDQISKEKFWLNTAVTGVTLSNNIYSITIKDKISSTDKEIKSKNIIFCGGKFGSLKLNRYIGRENLIFKKFEFGIRVETEPQNFDYKDYSQTDLKLIIQSEEDKEIEFRTFCFCRNGYVIHGQFENMNSYNGVSNKENHTKTNFGVNLRITNESKFDLLKHELDALFQSDKIIKQNLKIFLKENSTGWPDHIYKLFQDCLLQAFPSISSTDSEVTGPSFEYFGYYPMLNPELKLLNQNLWVCGDSTGDFRGLTPSLISGYLAGMSLVKKEANEKEYLYNSIRLKASPTKKTITVFTAQSKKIFYCKDVICEFVFNEGYIPINPFQTFGYFLNDRVDRNLIRNGNNELISRCDELWVFGPIADGVLFEIARAYELHMAIRFFCSSTHVHEIKEINDLNDVIFEPEVYAKIPRENLIKFLSKYHTPKIEVSQLKLNLGED